MRYKLLRHLLLTCMTIIALALGACGKFDAEEKAEFANRIVYFQDKRTGHCFAAISGTGVGLDSRTMTSVPCNEQTLLLANQ